VSCEHTSDSFKCVKYIRNYDGDTITFNIPGVHPLIGKKVSIRVNGVDTPEIRTKDKCEKRIGRIARKFVTNKLKHAQRIDLLNIKRGKYFRIVADVYIDDKNLKTVLLSEKLAYEYDGGTKHKPNWCNFKRLPASH